MGSSPPRDGLVRRSHPASRSRGCASCNTAPANCIDGALDRVDQSDPVLDEGRISQRYEGKRRDKEGPEERCLENGRDVQVGPADQMTERDTTVILPERISQEPDEEDDWELNPEKEASNKEQPKTTEKPEQATS